MVKEVKIVERTDGLGLSVYFGHDLMENASDPIFAVVDTNGSSGPNVVGDMKQLHVTESQWNEICQRVKQSFREAYKKAGKEIPERYLD